MPLATVAERMELAGMDELDERFAERFWKALVPEIDSVVRLATLVCKVCNRLCMFWYAPIIVLLVLISVAMTSAWAR